ncbi:hypothetical protein [Lysobacter capsici]
MIAIEPHRSGCINPSRIHPTVEVQPVPALTWGQAVEAGIAQVSPAGQ